MQIKILKIALHFHIFSKSRNMGFYVFFFSQTELSMKSCFLHLQPFSKKKQKSIGIKMFLQYFTQHFHMFSKNRKLCFFVFFFIELFTKGFHGSRISIFYHFLILFTHHTKFFSPNFYRIKRTALCCAQHVGNSVVFTGR